MAKSNLSQSRFGFPSTLVLTGFGIGWLAGLSVSPVISIIITSLTGSVAVIIATLSGTRDEFLKSDISSVAIKRFINGVTPVPLAWLVFGLVLGAGTGVWMRTHNSLSPLPQPPLTVDSEVKQWVDLGLPQEEVVRRLFDHRVSPQHVVTRTTSLDQSVGPQNTILYATASPAECKSWLDLIAKGRYEDLEIEVDSSEVVPFRELPAIVSDSSKLAQIVEKVLCADIQP